MAPRPLTCNRDAACLGRGGGTSDFAEVINFALGTNGPALIKSEWLRHPRSHLTVALNILEILPLNFLKRVCR
jgi:hypothetical protein